MLKSLQRLVIAWIPALAAAFVLGPVAGRIAGQLSDSAGGPQATLLVNQSPALGAMCAAGIAIVAALAGLLGVRLGSPNRGLLCAGIVLAWAAARTGRIDEIIAINRVSPFHRLVIEGLLIALVALLVVEVIRQFRRHTPPEPPLLLSARALGAGLIGAVFTAWLFAVDASKGQTIAAAAASGVMGAAIARMMLVSIPPRIIVIIPAALAIVSPLIAELITDNAVSASFGGGMFRLAWIAPLDWLAGGLIGIPLGLVWTDSIAEPEADHAEEPDAEPEQADSEAPRGVTPTVARHDS